MRGLRELRAVKIDAALWEGWQHGVFQAVVQEDADDVRWSTTTAKPAAV